METKKVSEILNFLMCQKTNNSIRVCIIITVVIEQHKNE